MTSIASRIASGFGACHAAGMDDHIGKPVNFEELRTKVVDWAARGATRESAKDPTLAPSRAPMEFPFEWKTVGHSRASRLLDEFRERLEQPLSDVDDVDLVAEEARALVSESGMLGFDRLSLACQELEQGCGASAPIASLVERVHVEAEAAREAISRFR